MVVTLYIVTKVFVLDFSQSGETFTTSFKVNDKLIQSIEIFFRFITTRFETVLKKYQEHLKLNFLNDAAFFRSSI